MEIKPITLLLFKLAILLEVPQAQDDPKEYSDLQQAYVDLLYMQEPEDKVLQLIYDKLEEFSI